MEDEFDEKLRDFMQDYFGHYAVLTGECYGDEVEINYLQKREKNLVIIENDFDSQVIIELKSVPVANFKSLLFYFSPLQLSHTSRDVCDTCRLLHNSIFFNSMVQMS